MSNVKTIGYYRKSKWLCFAAAILVYFLPFIIVTACLLPLTKQSGGTAFAIGIAIIAINALPFVVGIFKGLFAHYPMLTGLLIAVVFLAVYGFFKSDVFQTYASIFCWIEFAVAVGALASMVFWHFYRKNKRRLETAKTNKEMGLIK